MKRSYRKVPIMKPPLRLPFLCGGLRFSMLRMSIFKIIQIQAFTCVSSGEKGDKKWLPSE